MAKAKKETKKVAEWMYAVIDRPHVTEKATMGSAHGQVTFRVARDATKPVIKQAVEALFGVSVKRVNTVVVKGKEKRFKGILARRSDWKKAIVTLEDGQTIDTAAGI